MLLHLLCLIKIEICSTNQNVVQTGALQLDVLLCMVLDVGIGLHQLIDIGKL